MNGDTLASILYLGLLVTVIAGGFFVSNRQSLGKSAQQFAVWALIFVGFIAAYGLWGDISRQMGPQASQTVLLDGAVQVPRASDGHFYMTLEINDTPVNFMVDTGATDMVLTRSDARRVGLDPEDLAFLGQARTANGAVDIARATLETVQFGDAIDRNVFASVNGGELDISLLGMRYLDRFSTVQIAGDTLTLSR